MSLHETQRTVISSGVSEGESVLGEVGAADSAAAVSSAIEALIVLICMAASPKSENRVVEDMFERCGQIFS